jgi:DNA-binding HxlR family transcriptional regulator
MTELERAITDVSHKVLAQQLREPERDGMVYRTVHPQIPPRVEYGLTDRGRASIPALKEIPTWALEWNIPADDD